MFIKLGTVFLLLILSSIASADEAVTYLVQTRSDAGELLQGAAFTDSDQWEVDGYVILESDSRARASFFGSWTMSGMIEAVDSNGDMYLFNVIRVLNDTSVIN